MDWRQNEAIAGAWRKRVFSDCRWERSENQAGALTVPGESGGFFAHCEEELPGRRVYLKPELRDDGEANQRAAREKIAADLAHDIGLTVPPVLLARREDREPGEEEFVCVSLVLTRTQWSWRQIRPILERGGDRIREQLRERVAEEASRALVFDTWVGQTTGHKDHPHNIVFGYDGRGQHQLAHGRFIFLDFAWALGFGNWFPTTSCEIAGFPELMLREVDRSKIFARRTFTKPCTAFPPHFCPTSRKS